MVKWTNHAKSQLHHIYKYIAQDSPLYARRVSEALVKIPSDWMSYPARAGKYRK